MLTRYPAWLGLLLLFALVVTLVAACGQDEEPRRSVVAERLAALCTQARADIEALGLPAERGVAVVRPWANRGTRLAEAVADLGGATAEERRLLGSLSTALDEYYAGLRLGATIYRQTQSLEAYAATVERAKAFLVEADSFATQLGALECTVRPFDED